MGNLVRPESHPEPRGLPVQWADPGVEAVDESVPLMGSRELTHR